MAMMGEPIVGMDRVIYDETTGPGALQARPLVSPKAMSAEQRAVHDLTHLPYHPGCEICVSCRRPNTHHKSLKNPERTVPLMVGDYCFPKHNDDSDPMTVLVIRVYPYKLFFACSVSSKGRDPHVINRLARFIKECGLLHFTFRSDREPAIMSMMEEAVALSGRRGTKDNVEEAPGAIAHDELFDANGDLRPGEAEVDGDAHVPSTVAVDSAHTAAPELTHPGESQSNGLAERSVGIFEDQFRTLKSALEIRLKHRLPVSHPVTSWLVEHTCWVLNKFHLDSEGRTAYGRLHGREGRERICEFGERILWYVPKKLRSKLDQRWRYGVFLGRSLSSDQNFIGLSSGEVVCARAIVRVVPSIRWSSDMISKISTPPLTFRSGTLDRIEEHQDPQAHPDPTVESADARQSRRLRILDSDVRKYGFTDSCPRCEYLRQGRTMLARGSRHNEACRDHIYEALKADGAEKVRRVDQDDPTRNASRSKTVIEDKPKAEEAPQEPLATMEDVIPDSTPKNDEPNSVNLDDTYNFHEEVDEALDDAIDVDWQGDDLVDYDDDNRMVSMVDILQTLGVSVGDAVAYAVKATKDKVPVYGVVTGQSYNPTFIEVYGHGTIVQASHGCRRSLNVNGLNALDLRTSKPNGEPWDFSKASDRQLARSMIEEQKPTWVVGSPPCTFFSAWNQGINHKKMRPERVEALRKEAILHLHFVAGLYKLQLDGGRHFLHEHPATATSWSDPWITKLMQHPKVSAVVSDQCEYGLLTPDTDGIPTPAKKPTRWMSSSPFMLNRLSRRCKGDHVHQHLVGGRAKAAEDYSVELVSDILRGMRDTADAEEKWGDETSTDIATAMCAAGVFQDVHTTSVAAAYRNEDLDAATQKLTVKVKYAGGRSASTELIFKETYKDEYTNEQLPIGHVRTAMHDELVYFCDKVWELVPIEEVTGKVIGSRWVNCNKNDIADPDVRCRLVGQEVNLFADESFYTVTPPLEAKRLIFSEYASEQSRNGKPLQISFIDVKKAYFYGVPTRDIYVRLPYELGVSKKFVGKLVRCMYGTRDAGAIWESCYASALINLGFVQGGASPCCFAHPTWGVSVVVHGDDFTALGTSDGLDLYEKGMCEAFECKIKGRLGAGPKDAKEMRVLNRIVRITEDGLRYEADPRHAEMLIKAFKLEGSRHVVTPGVKDPNDKGDYDQIDQDIDEEISHIIAELSPKTKPMTKVKFSDEVEIHNVVAYSNIYGRHPKSFNFSRHGKMLPTNSNDQDALMESWSPNLRRTILEHVLRNGAAWEVPTVEYIAKVSKKKFTKARVGSKAAKEAERMECKGDELDAEASTIYRALSARLLYLSMDRPEMAFCSKELCRHFAHPTKAGVDALKRAVRFLVGLPRLVWHFPFQSHSNDMDVYVDTDFAGCHTTRRSTSGGIAMRGRHPIKHWSTTQPTIALSSGEAELGGICRGASLALGLQSLAKDLGIQLNVNIHTDATAAIGICRRRGLGKIRHLAVSDLWIQDRLKKKDFTLTKVLGADNPADLLTKHVSRELMLKHMEAMNLRAEDGRASGAPTLQHS